jgi:hypothetical protein
MTAGGPSDPPSDGSEAPVTAPAPAQTPPPPAGGYAGPPYAPYGAPPGRRPGTGWWVGAVVAVLVVGVSAYLVGHEIGATNERENFDAGAPGYNVIYQQGFDAGKDKGAQQGQVQGAAAGKQTGLEEGEQQGKEQGEAQGTAAGASAALGGFSTWEPGAPYIVKVRTGTDPVPYEIASRTQLEADTEYALCKDDPTQVCTVAKTDAGGSSGP